MLASGSGGQVGAGEDTEVDVAFDDECEADGVLLVAQKALGAVDGVDGPEAAGRVVVWFA